MDPDTRAPTGPQKPLDEAIAEYLMACEVESKSPRTVQAYGETLRVFGRKSAMRCPVGQDGLITTTAIGAGVVAAMVGATLGIIAADQWAVIDQLSGLADIEWYTYVRATIFTLGSLFGFVAAITIGLGLASSGSEGSAAGVHLVVVSSLIATLSVVIGSPT